MSKVSFRVSNRDARIIGEIAGRAVTELRRARETDPFDRLTMAMDLTAVHANGCPLRLEALRDADRFNFAHDILGIRRHLNRDTGQIDGLFSPRFSK